ncbi:MAG: hypothetical protein QG608_1446 [Actinomycetota bacterium]|nr:hypothetical protein [Actinomycetota bacterium]
MWCRGVQVIEGLEGEVPGVAVKVLCAGSGFVQGVDVVAVEDGDAPGS